MARRGLVRLLLGCALAAVLAAAVACHHPAGPDPCTECGGGGPPPPPGDKIFVGAGDIARCTDTTLGRELTAKLIDQMPDAVVFTAGDNAYPNGSDDNYRNCYDQSWGRFKSRTKPSPGNHEYETAGASGYFNYFGSLAGPSGLGYYAVDVGAWRVISLNSEIAADLNSPQLQFLKNDLQTNARPCTLAIWHRPLFNSGASSNGEATQLAPLFRALYDANAEIVINGHEHLYERYAPQDPDRHADPARGIREFIVGTGGVDGFYDFAVVKPNSEVRIAQTWGVLKLVLSPNSYTWNFIPAISGGLTDSGSGTCH